MPVTPRPPRFCVRNVSMRDALDVAADRIGHDDVDVRNELLHRDLVFGRLHVGAPLVAELLLDLERLALDDLRDAALAAQDVLQFGDRLDQLGVLVFDLLALEADQRAQAHVDDRLRLNVGEAEARREFGLGFVGRLAAAHDLDDFVDVVERDAVAFEQVRALFGFAQIVARAPRDDVFAVRDEVLEQLLEVEHLRLERDRSVGARFAHRHERQHVEAEARLQRRMLEELIEHDFRRRALLQLDDDVHALAIGEVVEARDALNALLSRALRRSLRRCGSCRPDTESR